MNTKNENQEKENKMIKQKMKDGTILQITK